MQINELNRPHCDECGKIYGGETTGTAYVFNLAIVKLCEGCNDSFIDFFNKRTIERLNNSKKELDDAKILG